MSKAFFDTNVLLYLFSGDERKAERAEDVISGGGVVNVQVLNEFASVALRKMRLGIPEIRETLTAIRRICSVRAIDLQVHDLALDLLDRYGLPLYDALIVAAALNAQCGILYTEDLQNGQSFGPLRVRNPFV